MSQDKNNKQLNYSEINQKAEKLEKIKNKVKANEKLTESENKIYQNYLNIIQKFAPVYENTPYGELAQLYDFVKTNDVTKMNDVEKQSFKIELDELVNNLIDYVSNEPIREYKFKNILNRLKYLYALYYDVDVFSEDEKKAIELNDAFDVEQKDIKAKASIKSDARNIILKAIDEVKTNHHPKGGKKKYAEYQKLFSQTIPDAAFDELVKADIKDRFMFLYLTGDLERIFNENNQITKETFDKVKNFTGGKIRNQNYISITFLSKNKVEKNLNNYEHKPNLKCKNRIVKILKNNNLEYNL